MRLEGEHFPISDFGGSHGALRKLRAFRDRAMLNKCMWWNNCAAQPDNSHSIARSFLARRADETKHVIQFRFAAEDAGKRPVTVVPDRVGINEATVFRGFCQKHDSEVFACLEKEEFVASDR